MLINVKMPTNVGILTFMSRINSCLAELIEHGKNFITSGPGWILTKLGRIPPFMAIFNNCSKLHYLGSNRLKIDF